MTPAILLAAILPAIAIGLPFRAARKDRQRPGRASASSLAKFLAGLLRRRQKARRVRRMTLAGLLFADPDDPDTWPGSGTLTQPSLRPLPVIHYWAPQGDDGRLDCCGGDPFAPGLSITANPKIVTCRRGGGES